jgi:hypothetical protein
MMIMISQRFPNVVMAYFKNCFTPTDSLLDLCGRVDVLQIEDCETEFAEACTSRFSGHKLRVNMRDQFLIPAFSVARLKHLELSNCTVTDNVIECIVGARLLEFLDLANSSVSDTQLRRVIDNIKHTPLRGFWKHNLSVENRGKLLTVFRGKSVLSNVSVLHENSLVFRKMTDLVSSRWFKNCVTLLVSEGNPNLKVGVILHDLWRRLFSEYLRPKP